MAYLDKAVDIKELGQSNLWVIYGKSASGKTHLLSTFPKPLLYLKVGDDGSNTIHNVEGIDAIEITTLEQLRGIALELRLSKKYKTVATDTFSLVVNEWIDANATQKKKKLTQQMWGDLKTDTEEFIKLFHILAKKMCVVLTCHEVTDTIDGLEGEITPDVRPSVSKGARTYLESMSNFGIHTVVVQKDVQKEDGSTDTVTRYAAHIGSNPYYWVKTQKPADIKLPKLVINPTYDRFIKLLRGDR